MSGLIKSNRDEIEYHHRKYKINLSGRSTTGEYVWIMPPPNEKAFSDRYSQCLVKISRVIVHNAEGTSMGFDDVWTNQAGAAIDSDNIMIETDIASGNCISKNDLGLESISKLAVVMSHAVDGGSFPYPSAVALDGFAAQGAVSYEAGPAGAASRRNVNKGLVWKYQDDRSIEDAGVLCGNIFGRPIRVSTRVAHDGAGLVFGGKAKLTALAGGGGASVNSLFLELEVLMLSNPTSGN